MRYLLYGLLFALAACNATPGDDGGDDDSAAGDNDIGAGDLDQPSGDSFSGDLDVPEPVALEIGEIVDMTSEETGVSIDLAQAGTYIVVLVSTAEEQGTTYGYGLGLFSGWSSRPSDPPPPKWPPPDDDQDQKTVVGEQRDFWVYNGVTTVSITAEATRVTSGFVLWEDQTTANPLGAIDYVKIDQVLADLEALVVPREEQIFGTVSDVDGDGQLAVLLSYTVNQYGPKAYVTHCDIGVTQGCPATNNGGELIYLGIPDPADSSSSVNGLVETVAHELNHLIYGHHKYVLNGIGASEENIYVTEGMSALAQDLTGYNNGNQYVWAAAIDNYTSVHHSTHALSINDLFRGSSYYDVERDGALRGGGYLVLRYLFEQAGGMTVEADGTLVDNGGMAWVQAYFDGPELGVAAIEATTGRDVSDIAMDWYTALVVTGRGLNADPAYNYQDRFADPITGYSYGFDPFATIHGWLQLDGPPVQIWAQMDGEIRAGGVEYLQIAPPAGYLFLGVHPDALARARIFRID